MEGNSIKNVKLLAMIGLMRKPPFKIGIMISPSLNIMTPSLAPHAKVKPADTILSVIKPPDHS